MTAFQPAVLVVGEALVDVVHSADGSVTEHVGGSPANVAMGTARLGHPTHLVACLGSDERGDRIAEAVAASGASLLGERSAERTSTALATLDPTGAATYTFDLEWIYDAPAVDRALAALAPGRAVGHVHTGSLGAVLEPGGPAVLEHLRGLRGTCTISYDPNARPGVMGEPQAARRRVEAFCAVADVVKCSDEDLAWLYPGTTPDAAAGHLLSLGPRLVVVTRGAEGALVLWRDAEHDTRLTTRPAPPVTVVDTVGAGDSFMAGLLSALLDAGLLGAVPTDDDRHAPASWHDAELLLAAVDRGLATAAWTVQRAGAGGPGRDELA